MQGRPIHFDITAHDGNNGPVNFTFNTAGEMRLIFSGDDDTTSILVYVPPVGLSDEVASVDVEANGLTTTATMAVSDIALPRDCALLENGFSTGAVLDGAYTIDRGGGTPLEVFCLMDGVTGERGLTLAVTSTQSNSALEHDLAAWTADVITEPAPEGLNIDAFFFPYSAMSFDELILGVSGSGRFVATLSERTTLKNAIATRVGRFGVPGGKLSSALGVDVTGCSELDDVIGRPNDVRVGGVCVRGPASDITAWGAGISSTHSTQACGISPSTARATFIAGRLNDFRDFPPADSCAQHAFPFGHLQSGFYRINGTSGTFDAYCDQVIDGGGYMLIARSATAGVGGFGWFDNSGAVDDVGSYYSLGPLARSISFNRIIIGRSSKSNRITDQAFLINVSSFEIGIGDPIEREASGIFGDCIGPAGPVHIDDEGANDRFVLSTDGLSNNEGLIRDAGFVFTNASGTCSLNLLNGHHGLIFVR